MQTRDAITRFCEGKGVVWQSQKTTNLYQSVLGQFATKYPELPETPEEIERFLISLNIANYSRYTYFRILKTFYRWSRRRLEVVDPIPDVDPPSGRRPRPRILSMGELEDLLLFQQYPERVHVLVHLLADTGIRIGEAGGLTLKDVTEDTIIVRGKTGEREVPCTPSVCASLRRLANDEGVIWDVHLETLKKWVRQAMRKCGLEGPKLGAHVLRHTFATFWEGSDADLQTILGHATPSMTLWYRQYRLSRAKRDHALYSPRRMLLANT